MNKLSAHNSLTLCALLALLGCALACDKDDPDPEPMQNAGSGGAGGDSGGASGASGEGGEGGDSGGGGGNAMTPQLAVTADMANRTLSIVDINLLTAGSTRSDALVGTVDLSAYAPGPMSLAITPDGKTAVVSISAGFLTLVGAPVMAGEDKLLFVDLETRTVTGELVVGSGPMGIGFSPDSKRAFVGLFGQSYFAHVDIEAKSYEPIETGANYNEEFAIDDTGTVGIMTYGAAGNVRTFSVADPVSMLGLTPDLTGDAAGVAFFPGTKIAYLVQAPTSLTGNVGGHNLVDVTNPAMPVSSDNVRLDAHPTAYPVTAVPARSSIAFPTVTAGMLSVVEKKLEGGVAVEAQTIAVGPSGMFAYGIGASHDTRVLVADPGAHTITVVDLATGTSVVVPWEGTEYGPTEVKVVPQP